ncbi:MAG: fumarate hydratase [Treponema sp.]|nr:fumarate hydratase [Treponema sp.]
MFSIIREQFNTKKFRPVPAGENKPKVVSGGLFLRREILETAAEAAFKEIAFYFRKSHLALLGSKLNDPDCSKNDRSVLRILLKNAISAAKGSLALCQDTGTAIIYGWKSENIFTGIDDSEAFEKGIQKAYKDNFLRFSQIGAKSFFDEFNTGNNLPAQIHIAAIPPGGDDLAYRFLFIAKGGGSANKTSLFSMNKALLEEKAFAAFLEEKIRALGTAACPPYRLAVVTGGASPEQNLEVLKLASAEALDGAPCFAEGEAEEDARTRGWIRRDSYWEQRILKMGKETGLGAQFGGSCFLLDCRVLRLPRHAASCFVSIGVSCAAHRNILGYINKNGLFIEELCRKPGAFLRDLGVKIEDETDRPAASGVLDPPLTIKLDKPLSEICRELSDFRAGDKLLLFGKLLLARDAAHLKWQALIEEKKPLPDYLFKYPIYYAAPAGTPPGKASGSLGPTTANRMDSYAEALMCRGASLVTVAKGNRSAAFRETCKKYRGFYLGTVGGAAALLAEENVIDSQIIDYPELGMEAVRLITVKDLPAFIIIDDKGGDLYSPELGQQTPIQP